MLYIFVYVYLYIYISRPNAFFRPYTVHASTTTKVNFCTLSEPNTRIDKASRTKVVIPNLLLRPIKLSIVINHH